LIAEIAHVWRLARAAFVFARYDVRLPVHLKARIPLFLRLTGGAARLAVGEPRSGVSVNAERLAAALTALGPAFVKLGQFLATRPDILGTELTNDLRSLQDRMPPFAMKDAVRTIERELGRPLKELYGELSPPVAAASIAQVHRARLIAPGEEGTEVAVKVLRPGIEAAFARDLGAFAFAARLMAGTGPEARRLEPVKLAETLAASVKLELDLRLEAAAASEIAEAARPEDGFFVPAIHWALTTKRVMTAGWVDGIPLADLAALDQAGVDRPALARQILAIFLNQALRDGVFHADMHPGNLFVLPARGDQARPLIAAVDYGIIGRLDKRMRRFMAETLYGFLKRDYGRIADAHFEVGFVAAGHSREEFAQALRSIGEPVFGRQAHDISMARLLAQLFEVTRLFDMRLQPQLLLLQKTMVVVEGVARELDPDLDIWEGARPVVEAWMARELGPEARLQEAADVAVNFARVAVRAPEVLAKMEAAAGRLSALTERGLHLVPSSAQDQAEAQERHARHARWALWAALVALVALVATALS
jgi:ubiquinone biosynthesis protein